MLAHSNSAHSNKVLSAISSTAKSTTASSRGIGIFRHSSFAVALAVASAGILAACGPLPTSSSQSPQDI
jgi:hypothetical protein